jgi:hypothetical protein
METKKFRSLAESVIAVQRGNVAGVKKPLNEAAAPSPSTEVNPLVEAITGIIAEAEQKLGTQFSAEEIEYSANYIAEQFKAVALIEAVQNHVGFELNENEIQYVFNTLNEIAG